MKHGDAAYWRAYAEHTLTGVEREEAEAHLETCDSCLARYMTAVSGMEQLDFLAGDAAKSITDGVMEAIKEVALDWDSVMEHDIPAPPPAEAATLTMPGNGMRRKERRIAVNVREQGELVIGGKGQERRIAVSGRGRLERGEPVIGGKGRERRKAVNVRERLEQGEPVIGGKGRERLEQGELVIGSKRKGRRIAVIRSKRRATMFHYLIAICVMLLLMSTGVFQRLALHPHEATERPGSKAASVSTSIMARTTAVIDAFVDKSGK